MDTALNKRNITMEDAVRLHQAGNYEAAAAIYRRLSALNPAGGDEFHLLALATRQIGDINQALKFLRRARQLLSSDFAGLAFNIANMLGAARSDAGRLLVSHRIEKALELAMLAAPLAADQGWIYAVVAEAAGRSGDFRRMAEYGAISLALEPDNPGFWYRMSVNEGEFWRQDGSNKAALERSLKAARRFSRLYAWPYSPHIAEFEEDFDHGFRPSRMVGDGREYSVLYEAARSIVGVPGLTCEIGCRLGGGSEAIIRGLHATGQQRVHIGIDPYENLPNSENETYINIGEKTAVQMRTSFLCSFTPFALELGIRFFLFPISDVAFFKLFNDEELPIFVSGVPLRNEYALVHFDGPHVLEHVMPEIEWFAPRTPPGGVWIFDDIQDYDHSIAHCRLLELGFKVLFSGFVHVAYVRA